MTISKAIYKCKECHLPFSARVADRNRGWARYCSKSCKAIKQTKSMSNRQGNFIHGAWEDGK